MCNFRRRLDSSDSDSDGELIPPAIGITHSDSMPSLVSYDSESSFYESYINEAQQLIQLLPPLSIIIDGFYAFRNRHPYIPNKRICK